MSEEILEEEDTQKDKYLTFFLGEETYGIDIHVVMEIIGILPITKVPEVPDYVQGIINLRGKIIPVVDMRLRFRRAFRPYTDRTCDPRRAGRPAAGAEGGAEPLYPRHREARRRAEGRIAAGLAEIVH